VRAGFSLLAVILSAGARDVGARDRGGKCSANFILLIIYVPAAANDVVRDAARHPSKTSPSRPPSMTPPAKGQL